MGNIGVIEPDTTAMKCLSPVEDIFIQISPGMFAGDFGEDLIIQLDDDGGLS